MGKKVVMQVAFCSIALIFFFSCTKLEMVSNTNFPISNSGCKKAGDIHISAEKPERPYKVLTHIKLIEYIESGSLRQKRTEENLFQIVRKNAAKYCGDEVIEIRFESAEDSLRNTSASKKFSFFSEGYTQKFIISGKVIKWID